ALFGLDDGSWLLYSDQRRFGTMRLLGPDEQESYWRGRLGPEPLSPEWTPTDLRQALRGRRAPIKALLLDQRVVAGVGNIYADEALWEPRAHPPKTRRPPSRETAHPPAPPAPPPPPTPPPPPPPPPPPHHTPPPPHPPPPP